MYNKNDKLLVASAFSWCARGFRFKPVDARKVSVDPAF